MAWMFVIVVMMMLVTSLLIGAIVQRSIYEDYDRQLNADVEETSATLDDFFPRGVPLGMESSESFQELKHHLNRRALGRSYYVKWFIHLYDANHREIFRSEGAPDIDRSAIDFSAGPKKIVELSELRWIQAPYPNAHAPALWLLIGRSRQPLQEDLDLLNYTLSLRMLFVVVLAPAAGYFVARQITGPVFNIISTAARLQPQKLSERLPIRGTADELDVLSRTINGMLDRVAEFIEKNREFVANAAHELRSPLAAMRASTEVALGRERTPEEYAGVLADLAEEVGQLSHMVNRLLLLAESDAGRFAPSGHRARLDKVVRESVDMFHPVAESQNVGLKTGELAAVEILAEDVSLRHLVRNLIDNAIKFSNPGTEVTIDLRADLRQRTAILEVRDHGVGIPPEDLPRLFERFFRGDKARLRSTQRAGTGLGLSICYSIVIALGGRIDVTSTVGKGTTFMVTLPLCDVPSPVGPREPPVVVPAAK
jgi:heavy metal sensor kinase